MYKTIKIPKEAYEEAKLLSKELEKSREITGVFNVNLSTAVSYAIEKMLENIRRKKRFISSAGSWKNIPHLDKIKEDVYDNRKVSNREAIAL